MTARRHVGRWIAPAFASAALLGACVLPSTQTSIRDLLARQQTPRPGGAGAAASQSPGPLVIVPVTPGPDPGSTPDPGQTTAPAGGGRLLLEADLNVGTPRFTVQATGIQAARAARAARGQALPAARVQGLPPGFASARFQLAGAGGQTSRIGDLAIDPASGRGGATISDLPPGTYAILVVALETGGLVVASGTGSIEVPAGGEATAAVRVESSGQQKVRIDLPGELPAPTFTLGAVAGPGGAA